MADISDILAQLVRRRDQARAEVERLERAIRALSDSDDPLIAPTRIDSDVAPFVPVDKLESLPKGTELTPDEVVKVAREVLLRRARPLKRGTLVRVIEEHGFKLAGNDKAKNLGTILWRHRSEFVHIEKYGYWPRDVPFADVFNPANPPDGIYSTGLKR